MQMRTALFSDIMQSGLGIPYQCFGIHSLSRNVCKEYHYIPRNIQEERSCCATICTELNTRLKIKNYEQIHVPIVCPSVTLVF